MCGVYQASKYIKNEPPAFLNLPIGPSIVEPAGTFTAVVNTAEGEYDPFPFSSPLSGYVIAPNSILETDASPAVPDAPMATNFAILPVYEFVPEAVAMVLYALDMIIRLSINIRRI